MILKNIHDFVYQQMLEYLTCRYYDRLWITYSKDIVLRPLSAKQKSEIKTYWREISGQNVSTRWHQLLYSLTGKFSVEYMPFEIYSKFLQILSPRDARRAFDDKNLYRYLLKDFHIPHRVAECCNGVYFLPEKSKSEVGFDQLLDTLYNVKDCIIKPSRGTDSGNGVVSLDVCDGIVEKSGEELSVFIRRYGDSFCVERKIHECENLQCLNSSSCNTIRVLTYRDAYLQKIRYILSYIRIGRKGNVMDNACSGGLCARINSDGVLENAVSLYPYKEYTSTDSSIIIRGYQIENHDKIVNTAVAAHSALPMFGFIGWDMVIDSDGNVVIIEFNPDPDMRFGQVIFKSSYLGEHQVDIMRATFRQGK